MSSFVSTIFVAFAFTLLLLPLGVSVVILLNSLQEAADLILIGHLDVLQAIYTIHIDFSLGVTGEYDG